MIEHKHEQILKDVGIDNDCLCIELLNGLRLMGPLNTKPVYRDAVVPEEPHRVTSTAFPEHAIAT